MARPQNPDRRAVADANLSVRLTTIERARWDALVAKCAAELRGTGARITAASLARDVLVAHLDAAGVTEADLPPPAAPAPAVPPPPEAAAQPLEVKPSERAAAATKNVVPFWYGISLDAGDVDVLRPRAGEREDVEQACRVLGVALRGPFETLALARGAFEREQAELERRANAPAPAAMPGAHAAAPSEPPPIEVAPVKLQKRAASPSKSSKSTKTRGAKPAKKRPARQ